MDFYESFKSQILKNKMGELRTREKTEFFAKVAQASYKDEMKKISSESMEGVVPRLVKRAMFNKAVEMVSKDVNQTTSKRGEHYE